MTSVPKFINTFLKTRGVNVIFGYSGGSIMPLIDTFYNDSIRFIVNSNEQCIGHAATAYSKTSNKTGVAVVTSGPGITNMITPMLELSKNVTKWSYQIKNVSEIKYSLEKAFYIANNNKKGAVHIDIPKCIFNQEFDIKTQKIFKEKSTEDKEYDYLDVANIINVSRNPIFYLGKGCNNDYKLLRSVARKGNIPVTTTIHGCGIMDENDKLSLGWCGMHGSEVSTTEF